MENVNTLNPDVTNTKLEHFSPMDYEYQVTSISLGDANYFNSFSEFSESSNSDTDSDEQKPCLIKHDPDTLWGYDDKELVIAAVSDFELANYQWYKDGKEMQSLSGINKKCIRIHDKGTYTVVVTHKDKIDVSKPLHVTLVNNGPRNEKAKN